MFEFSMFLTFCITIVALVALGNNKNELAKIAIDYLGQLVKSMTSPIIKVVIGKKEANEN